MKEEKEIEDTVKGKRVKKQIDRGFNIARKWTKEGTKDEE